MKTVLLFLTTIFFCFTASASTVENPLLWKVQKGEKVGYLFGTFHLGFGIKDLPQEILETIKSSDSFYMETDLSGIDQAKLQAQGMYQNGKTLDQYLPETSWNKLVTLLAPVMPAEQLKMFEPWFVINMLITPIAIQQLNYTASLDLELLDMAKNQGLKLGYLEPADLQFAVLEAISPVDQLDTLLSQSENIIQDSMQELMALRACYEISDVDCLTKMTGTVADGGKMEAWQYQLLLSQRNKTWIPVIDKALQSEKAFIAVGAGHLIGEMSIQNLLKAEGYTIERVQF